MFVVRKGRCAAYQSSFISLLYNNLSADKKTRLKSPSLEKISSKGLKSESSSTQLPLLVMAVIMLLFHLSRSVLKLVSLDLLRTIVHRAIVFFF